MPVRKKKNTNLRNSKYIKEFKEISESNLDVFVSKFTLQLYHNGLLDIKWMIPKEVLRKEFIKFCDNQGVLYDRNKDLPIGTLLYKTDFLLNTPRDSSLFCLRCRKIYDYENTILDDLDKEQIEKTKNRTLLQQITDQKSDDFEVDENSIKETPEFESCTKTKKNNEFVAKIFSCYICQINFQTKYDFEEHLPMHNDITDFEWLNQNESDLKSNLEIFYQTCRNPLNLKFTIKAKNKNVNIDRIITIKSNSIETIMKKNGNCEKNEDGSYYFIVDRHIFSVAIQQPLVLIYHFGDLNELFIEHYFMRLSDSTSFAIRNFPQFISRRIPTRPELSTKFNIKNDQYPPCEVLRQLLKDKSHLHEEDFFSYSRALYEHCQNEKKINISNAAEILKILLQLEEFEQDQFFSNLNQYDASIKGFGKEFSVKMSLKKGMIIEDILKPGDEVFLNYKENILNNNIPSSSRRCISKEKIFVGKINRVYGLTVCFDIRQNAKKIDKSKQFIIKFRPNRRNYQYQYYAIEKLEKNFELRKFLFPTINEISNSNFVGNVKLNIINDCVRENPEQKQAVTNIVVGIKYLPYIIVGPPGTGKTTTIVESILQVKLCHLNCRILITSGSNAACDEVAKRLLKLIEKTDSISHIKLLRLYAKSVEKRSENIEEVLIEASNLAHGFHFYPAFEIIEEYDIVVCTLSVIGRLKSSGMSDNFFSHCFIDECAASTEIESLIGISAVFHPNINVIVAGDTKQLGPILRSDWAANFGLQHSLMDRLLDLECYKVCSDKTYNRRIQTRLIRNFRTHADILTISNQLFYSGDLLSCASKDITHWATDWYCLPDKKVPLIFDCVNGYTKKDKFSTSLYNSREVDIVIRYVKKLMYFNVNGRQIREEDIGVISPYKKQNIILREELDKRNWYKIASGSVETFQGQEKPIIIISTVRSIHSDKSGIGFLDNEKRLNVMMTRAQALLIVVGNPELLISRPIWRNTINYLLNFFC